MTSGEDAVVVDVPDTPSAPGVLVRVEHVATAFGPTQALRDCSFELRAGEVHALAGENGSGKSTLVKILSGVHAPDSGQLQIGGADAQLRNPKGAQELGVVTAHPEQGTSAIRARAEGIVVGRNPGDGAARSQLQPVERRDAVLK